MLLPTSSLLPFEAQKVAYPNVVWIGDRINESRLVEQAYAIRAANEPPDAYLPSMRTFNADRYGGYGVGYCGGSARCGEFDGIQIKGIGPNLLHATKPYGSKDKWHGTGALSLMEAGREVIWSALLDEILPFGALRALGIVSTGTETISPYLKTSQESSCSRVLLFRDFAIRPGHFMRNIHFNVPGAELDDVKRVRLVLQRFIPIAARLLGNGFSAKNDANEILIEMASRYATQVAVAFVKRVFHGSLNCTNIALDGAFLDFGTITTVPSYRREASVPMGFDQLNQQDSLLRSLILLREHLVKYENALEEPLVGVERLREVFSSHYCTVCAIEFAKLTGIPNWILAVYPIESKLKFLACLMKCIHSPRNEQYVLRGDDECGKVPPNGMFASKAHRNLDVSALFQKLSLAKTRDESVAVARSVVKSECDASNIAFQYWEMRCFAQRQVGALLIDPLARHIRLEAHRLNSDISFLSRQSLDAELADMDSSFERLPPFVSTVIGRARDILLTGTPDGGFALHSC